MNLDGTNHQMVDESGGSNEGSLNPEWIHMLDNFELDDDLNIDCATSEDENEIEEENATEEQSQLNSHTNEGILSERDFELEDEVNEDNIEPKTIIDEYLDDFRNYEEDDSSVDRKERKKIWDSVKDSKSLKVKLSF